MLDKKELKPGDACPNCGGEFAPDLAQHSTALIDHHKRNAASPAVSARYAEQVEEKIRTSGELFACRSCGYQHRFGPDAATRGPARRSRAAEKEPVAAGSSGD